jgi:general secretion pathway protein G
MKNGFTLVELVLTVAILGLLASIALPLAEVHVQRNKEQELRVALREIRTAIDAYKRAVDEGSVARSIDRTGYPPKLEVLVEGVEDQRKPDKPRVYFLRRLPRDPMTGEAWGLRSYASPHDSPQAGLDVYDVFSLSDAKGLNGVPYREW